MDCQRMPRPKLWWPVLLISFLPAMVCATASAVVREPAVAGGFYSDDPAELSAAIDRFLSAVPEQKLPGPLFGVVVPHAGYVYSGQVAAYGYKLLAGLQPETVIMIGPSHHMAFDGASIWQEDGWKTPLGEAAVDTELAKALAAESPKLAFEAKPHLPEHSLEVQVPFLQKTLKNFKIVPIAIGHPSRENARILSAAIFKHMQNKKIAVLVSTDLSHYYPDAQARGLDQTALELVAAGDPEKFDQAVREKKAELCGEGGVLVLMELAKRMGNTGIKVLHYANSGDVTQIRDKVVGYGAVAFYGTGPAAESKEGYVTDEQKRQLLKIARESVTAFLDGKPNPVPQTEDPSLNRNQGAFVTYHVDGQLRGCIGNPLPTEPLAKVVHEKAVDAASRDPRFPPIRKDELEKAEIEISVLTPPRQVTGADEIVLGRDGVVVMRGGQSGLFLPQVAEQLPTKELFLGELCEQKAGLPRDCWQDPATRLYVFEAQVFSERGNK